MGANSVIKSCLIALVTGALQYWLLLIGFEFLLRYVNPFGALLSLGLHGSALHLCAGILDLVWAVLLSVPAAIILLNLKPRRIWVYVSLAVIPTFLWLNLGLATNPSLYEYWVGFVQGWINELLPLPIAVFLLQKMSPWRTHRKTLNTEGSAAHPG